MSRDIDQKVLRTNAAGVPLEWINYQDAARLSYAGRIVYSCGSLLYTLHGGINRQSRLRSQLPVHAIIATSGVRDQSLLDYPPPLHNDALFRRDGYLCLYCGVQFPVNELSRDHIRPLSQGGQDDWNNVVAACRRCNHHKAARTPEEAGMELLAVPFTPTHAEYIYLQGKRVLADQMAFLRAHFPRSSPLHKRLS
ncbi:HNH endonuclease [Acidihalobacter prosperus]